MNSGKSEVLKLLLKFGQVFFLGILLWFFCKPEAISAQGWHLFVIFVCTIIAIVLKPLPMGAITLISVAFLTLTQTLPINVALKGFAYDQIWLIVFACFLARGFIKTGLGNRMAYAFVSLFGGNPIGLGYGLLVSSLSMAPLVPSATARTGGIILPVLKSLVTVMGHEPGVPGKGKKIAEYLTMIVFHGSVVSSAMFITGNAGNPIAVKFAQDLSIPITWGNWAMGAIFPGLLTLALLPPFLLMLMPCKVENPEAIRAHTKNELKAMGKITTHEKILLGVFSLLLVLWSCSSVFNVHPTDAALLGVAILLVTKVLSWKDLLSEDMAWDTFIWMAVLVMMASELQAHGVIDYFTKVMIQYIPSFDWRIGLIMISLLYYYSHYFFASVTAHVSSMYGPFLAVAIAIGTPPIFAALLLGYLSNLFGGLTHYASGPAPILYAQNYLDVKTWWKIGAITGVVYLILWGSVGTLWWKWLGIL